MNGKENKNLKMYFVTVILAAAAVTVAALPQKMARSDDPSCVPTLDVPACPDLGSISYTNTVPSTDNATFPKTEVALCYDDSFIHITFTALEETAFYCTLPVELVRIPRLRGVHHGVSANLSLQTTPVFPPMAISTITR